MRGPLIGGKDFQTSIGQGEQARGGVLEVYQGKKKILFWKQEEGGE